MFHFIYQNSHLDRIPLSLIFRGKCTLTLHNKSSRQKNLQKKYVICSAMLSCTRYSQRQRRVQNLYENSKIWQNVFLGIELCKLLSTIRRCKQMRLDTIGQISPKCKETSNLMWLSLIWFIFVCLLKLILYNSKPQNQICDWNQNCFCFALQKS